MHTTSTAGWDVRLGCESAHLLCGYHLVRLLEVLGLSLVFQILPYYCTKGVRVDSSMLELLSLSIASVVLYHDSEAAGEH